MVSRGVQCGKYGCTVWLVGKDSVVSRGVQCGKYGLYALYNTENTKK